MAQCALRGILRCCDGCADAHEAERAGRDVERKKRRGEERRGEERRGEEWPKLR
jgi:hypothetical protein